MSTVIDDLDRLDEAFAGNRLLSTFAPEARALIEPDSTIVELQPGEKVLCSGEHVSSSLFPFGPTMVSLSVQLDGGRSVEVASIGREGAIGGIISCGHAPAFSSAVVLGGGAGLQAPIGTLGIAKKCSPFVTHPFFPLFHYFVSPAMWSAACN